MAVKPVPVPVDEYTCDGCGKVELVPQDEGRPIGISGDLVIDLPEGGWSADFWACSKKCLGPATRNAFEKSRKD